jgi:hypothetical protein
VKKEWDFTTQNHAHAVVESLLLGLVMPEGYQFAGFATTVLQV